MTEPWLDKLDIENARQAIQLTEKEIAYVKKLAKLFWLIKNQIPGELNMGKQMYIDLIKKEVRDCALGIPVDRLREIITKLGLRPTNPGQAITLIAQLTR